MAIAIIMDFAGGTADQYEAVMEKMDLGGQLPPGAIFHATGSYNGGWRVVDAWESAEAFGAFADTRIRPYAAEAGLPEPSVQMFDVDELFDERGGGSGGVKLLQIVRLDGMTKEQFEQADAQIRDNKTAPDGCMFHVNGWTDSGWIVADAWTSREIRDAFIADKVGPAMGSMGMAPPVIEDLDIYNTLPSD